MSVIIFIIILGVLIFVHELGHFLVAKKTGIRVDEFAIGFPPRLFSFKKGGTRYSLNLIPFGGYVKIFGENPDEESSKSTAKDSFVNKPRYTQAAVLIAGILFNVIFAWIILTGSLMSGFPSAVNETNSDNIKDAAITIVHIEDNSPAEKANLMLGDTILKLSSITETLTPTDILQVQSFIQSHGNEPMDISVGRDNATVNITVQAEENVVAGKKAIGIAMDNIGTYKLPFFTTIKEGFLMTGEMIKAIVVGLGNLIGQAFAGKGSMSDVAGPVGIVSLVKDASHFGFVNVLSLTAILSLNLAVLNLVPFPALDGGRLLFVAIEAITRRPLNQKFANVTNLIGFSILILLMLAITVNDVVRLF